MTLNALTVDLEDWYHVCGARETANASVWAAYESRVTQNTDRVLSLLRNGGVRATFFVLGYLAEREPALVRAVAREGHEIATHGHFHRRLFELSPGEFEEDLLASLDAIRAAADAPVRGYRAPEWSIRRHTFCALPILRRHGIRYDSSMVPMTRMGDRTFPSVPRRFRTESGEIWEFPLTTFRFLGENLPFTGGLPLRIAPYWFVETMIRRKNRSGQAVVVYVHPWEFDREQPRLDLPLSRRFMHSFHIASTRPKLTGLLHRFRFGTIRDALGLGDA